MSQLNKGELSIPGWKEACRQMRILTDLKTVSQLRHSAVSLEIAAVVAMKPEKKIRFLLRAREVRSAADRLNDLALGIMPRRVKSRPLSCHSDPRG